MQKTAYCSSRYMPGGLQVHGMRKEAPKLFGSTMEKKILRAMKLTAFLLLAFCLHLSAKTFSQTITFTGKNISLKKVFTVIEQQAGYTVSGNFNVLKNTRPVSVEVNNMPVLNFLSLVFDNQPVDFHVDGKDIIISRKPVASLPYTMVEQPPLNGRVTDSLGNALAGASIRIKGRSNSVISDNNGLFTINAKPGDVLIVSFVGFATKEWKVNGVQAVNIALGIESMVMTEVAVSVNTGYQSIPRERATGSYAIIGADRLANKMRPDLKAALEGQAAGLNLTKDGSLEIRGVSSFSAEKAPLIIVDGFPITGGLETINIDNVESVTILKDAVAASIYGSRSSNGVIVITSKRGKKGALNVEYRGTAGLVAKPDLSYLNRASAADYVDAEMDLYNQSPNTYLNSYNNYAYLSRVNYLMVAKAQGLIPAADVDAQIAQLKTNDGLGQLQDYLFRAQLSQQHNISLSGGSDKHSAAANIKYIDNRGNTLYTGDNRLIADLRNDWKPNKRVTVKMWSNVNYSTSRAPVRTTTSLLEYYSNTMMHPYDLVVNPETGGYQDIFATNPRKQARYSTIPGLKPMNYNPLEDLGMEMTKTQNLQVRLGGSINVAITDGLNIEAGGSWTRGNAFSRSVYSKNSYRMRLGYNDGTSVSNPAKHYLPDGDMLTEGRNINQAYTLRAQLNYNKTFGKHIVMTIAGGEITRDVYDNNNYATRFGYNDQAGTFVPFNYADYNAGLYNADMLGTSKPQSQVSSGSLSFRDNRFVSWYGNGSYEFDNRFLLSGSIRLDQTNFFGTNPDYRYKPLWSVGGTYKLSNEQFFNVNWISKLYVRGSHGINGNISLNSGPFLIITPGSFSNLTGDISYTITTPPNNSLRWEKTVTDNVGVDVSFLRSRLNLSLDYYSRKSKDLLAPDVVDPTIGYTSLTRNVGQINNNGVELTLEGDVLQTKDFTWNVLGTVAYNKNKVIDYNVNYLYASSFLTSVNREGYAANAVFSYRNAGLDANGSPVYWDTKGQKVNGGLVMVGDLEYSGTLRPKFSYGLTNRFTYKNFELSFMMVAKTGAIMRKVVYDGSNIWHKDVSKRWKQPGDEQTTMYPKLSASSLDAFYFPFSNTFVESADFLKMRDASLTYTFSKKQLGKTGIKGASLSFQARNLFMVAANSDKRDPEGIELIDPGSAQAELGFTPFRPMPEFYFGLRVNF